MTDGFFFSKIKDNACIKFLHCITCLSGCIPKKSHRLVMIAIVPRKCGKPSAGF